MKKKTQKNRKDTVSTNANNAMVEKVTKKKKSVNMRITNDVKKSEQMRKPEKDEGAAHAFVEGLLLPQRVVLQIADEVAKRLRRKPTSDKKPSPSQKIENAILLDTSAIIDGRVFDLIKLGLFTGTFVVLDGVLSELKNIADSKDNVKKERGRKGLKYLDEVKKQRIVKLTTVKDIDSQIAVDDRIVSYAKEYKGRIITCDYNLSKKARISGVISIDMYELANILKTSAIPGEIFWIKVIQKGKGEEQGVGYLPDGTMMVVEKGEGYVGKTVQVLVSRIIQTDAGKIFFSKLMESN